MGEIRELVADLIGVSPEIATFIIGILVLVIAISLMKK